MGEAFLIQKLLGASEEIKCFATITVNYTKGATLICTDGVKTFRASNEAEGEWVFIVPYSATWAITATNDTDTETQNVTITERGQHESIYVMLPLVLVDADVYADVTGGFENTNLQAGGLNVYVSHYGTSANMHQIGYSSLPVSLAGYSQIHYTITDAFAKAGGSWSVGVSTNTSTGGYIASLSNPAAGTHSLDISSLTSSYYLIMQVSAWTTGGSTWTEGSLTVSKIWLT